MSVLNGKTRRNDIKIIVISIAIIINKNNINNHNNTRLNTNYTSNLERC